MTTADRSFRWLFWSLALLGLTLDLGSKYVIFRALYHEGRGGEFELIPGAFRLVAHYQTGTLDTNHDWLHPLRTWSGETVPIVNHGALFGIGGSDYNSFFTSISLVAAAAIIFWSTRKSLARDVWLCCALGLILAGTLGNLYDRLIFNGVRDFLHWYLLVDWPIFNLADCCLVCGASMLLIQALFFVPQENREQSAPGMEAQIPVDLRG